MKQEYLSQKEAAKRLGMKPASLRAAANAGRITPTRDAQGVRWYTEAEIESYAVRKRFRG